MKKYFLLTGMLVFAFLLGQPGAYAQIGSPYLVYQGAFNNAMFLTTKGAIERGIRSRDAKNGNSNTAVNSAPVKASLTFTSSAIVHNRVVQLMAKIMAEGDNAKIATDSSLLVNGNLLGEFNSLLHKYGFNSNNIGDVFAAYVILSWQAATGGDAAKSPKGIEIFRKAVQSSLASNENISQFSDGQKQQMAETIAYIATLVTLANQELVKKGDTKAIAGARQNMRQLTLSATGIDVFNYTLTQEGFVVK